MSRRFTDDERSALEYVAGAVEWVGDYLETSECGYGWDGGESVGIVNAMLTADVIPDVPNLAAVAAVLREYPEMGAALATISGLAGDTMTSAAIQGRASGVQTYTDLGEHQRLQDMVDALAAALNGGQDDAR